MIKASRWNIIMNAMIRHLSHAVMKWRKPVRWMYGCLSKSLTSLQARQGGNSSAWGSNLVLVNDDSTVMVRWSVGGTSRGLNVLNRAVFGTLHHTAALWRTHRKVGQTKVRNKVTGSMVDVHTHSCTQTDAHTLNTQADGQMQTFQPARTSSGWWLFQERAQH